MAQFPIGVHLASRFSPASAPSGLLKTLGWRAMIPCDMSTVETAGRPQPIAAPESHPLEVSVVIPCLNEAKSLSFCIEKALQAFQSASIQGEVVVADNGSTDGSVAIAQSLGARVVNVE